MARRAVPARIVAGGTNIRATPGNRKSCAAARGADIAPGCPYQIEHMIGIGQAVASLVAPGRKAAENTEGTEYQGLVIAARKGRGILEHAMAEGVIKFLTVRDLITHCIQGSYRNRPFTNWMVAGKLLSARPFNRGMRNAEKLN